MKRKPPAPRTSRRTSRITRATPAGRTAKRPSRTAAAEIPTPTPAAAGLIAHIAPFAVFFGIWALGELLASVLGPGAGWWHSHPQYWIFPLQTLAAGYTLYHFWPLQRWQPPTRPVWWLGAGIAIFLLWIAPQEVFAAAPRLDGFRPDFAQEGWLRILHIALRWLRLVVVVPMIEEIFWRGFVPRYVAQADFQQLPLEKFQPLGFGISTLCFALSHWGPDFFCALCAGAVYGFVACKSGRLSSCVLAHALTNLLLGIYLTLSGQWGFW